MSNLATCRTIGRGRNPYPANSPWRRKESGHASEIQRPHIYSKLLRIVVSPPEVIRETTEKKFRRLADKWHNETDMHSSTLKVVAHPAYLRIIAMGRNAIPLILREMKQGPGHWLPAINAITEDLRAEGENPASSCATSSEARAAWVKWGESKGYL
jgi:hypothetical protein